MNKLFSALPLWQPQGLAIIRIIVGSFLIYHGSEVFDAAKIKEYTTWDIFKNSSSPSFMVYMGKSAELIEGLLLVPGLLTRVASIAMIFTFLYIAFVVGQGKFWYEDQYPVLFALLALVFFFNGPGTWSIDQVILKRRRGGKVIS